MIEPEPIPAESPRRTLHVAAEPEEIYDFIGDPEHLDQWWKIPDDAGGPRQRRSRLRSGGPAWWAVRLATVLRVPTERQCL